MWRSFFFLSLIVLPVKKVLGQDTQGTRLLNKAYQQWSRGENDSALFTLDNIQATSDGQQDPALVANISYTKGIIYLYSGSTDSALFHLEKSKRIAQNTGAYQLLGMSLELEGQLRKSQGLLVRALELYDSARSVYQKYNLDNLMGTVLTEIGNLEVSLENFEAGKENHANALNFYTKTGDTTNLGLGKSNLAYAYSRLEDYEVAIRIFREAVALKKQYSSERSLSFTYQYMGEAFLDMGLPDSARKYLNLTYEIKERVGDPKGLAETANLLARLDINTGAMSQARSRLDSAYLWAETINSLSLMIENLEIQKDWNLRSGRYKQALKLDQRYDVLRDSLFKDEKLKVQRLQAEYSLNEKEQERQIASERAQTTQLKNQQQQVVIWIVLLLLAALGALAWSIWRSRKLTAEKNQLLESQNQLIEQQKNDIRHRAKNHMSMISYILTLMRRETKDQEVMKHIQSAQHLMLTFSSLEMHLYDKPTDSSIELRAYLEEWKEKFIENLPPAENSYDILIESQTLELSSKLVVPLALIITELATNSFKYVCLKGKDTDFSITAKTEGDRLELVLTDNGGGFSGNRQDGMGWQIIKTLCKSIKGQMDLESENGFRFQLTVNADK